jgi:hypothetical protein
MKGLTALAKQVRKLDRPGSTKARASGDRFGESATLAVPAHPLAQKQAAVGAAVVVGTTFHLVKVVALKHCDKGEHPAAGWLLLAARRPSQACVPHIGSRSGRILHQCWNTTWAKQSLPRLAGLEALQRVLLLGGW